MMDGATARWPDLLALAQRAEAAGFDSLWVPDHVLYHPAEVRAHFGLPVPPELLDTPSVGVWEAWTLLASLAAATTRVQIGPLVSCVGYRNPALLANMAATVNEVSGGRLVLGLGAGDAPSEHRALGVPTDHLVGRFEEALAVLVPLLREGQVDFDGTYHRARHYVLRPLEPRLQAPPLLMAGTGERMLRLVARYAEAWNAWLAIGRSHPDRVPPLRLKIDAACRAVGREPGTLERTVAVRIVLLGRTAPGAEPLAGSPPELAESLRAFAREGISHVQVVLAPNTLAGIEAFAPVLELLEST